MIAVVVAALGLLLGLMAPPPRRSGKGPSVAQLQRDRDYALRQAAEHGKAALGARAYARKMARDLQRFQWDGAFHQITDPVRAKRLLEACPQREALLVRYSQDAQRHEANAVAHQQVARALAQQVRRARALAHQQHQATPRAPRQVGLVLLARVCFQGWLAKRRKSMLY